jgi:kynurenine formamidase
MEEQRVQFDFVITFTNGGSIQGQEFRLDIEGDDIADHQLADYLVQDLRLLMVGEVKILNKVIISEPHKRRSLNTSPEKTSFVDLSHTIEHGLITYKGLPAPIVCDYLSREQSRTVYAPGTEFQIGKIEMVTNTGTYLDCPFHRYPDGKDTAQIELANLANIPGIVIRVRDIGSRAIDKAYFTNKELRGRAVLVDTGWDQHWKTDRYFAGHPYLTEDAAQYLQTCGAKLVGIDSLNIDNTDGKTRPVHSILLAQEILIVEHLCNLQSLPEEGFTFTAVPPKFHGVGTFPVRAFAQIPPRVLPEEAT